jgi:hypothetical protein
MHVDVCSRLMVDHLFSSATCHMGWLLVSCNMLKSRRNVLECFTPVPVLLVITRTAEVPWWWTPKLLEIRGQHLIVFGSSTEAWFCLRSVQATTVGAALLLEKKNWVWDSHMLHCAAAHLDDDAWERGRGITAEDPRVAGSLDSRTVPRAEVPYPIFPPTFGVILLFLFECWYAVPKNVRVASTDPRCTT